jgi:class 3 adenylate cyclase/pSer/pThr/pTyr-binding forkhead associated (FHA) protein
MNDQPSIGIPFNDLQEGTVTFLFTDIEGSTRLLYQLRENYSSLLKDQRLIFREAFANWKGSEIDTQGDAFFAAFPRATLALKAAVEAERKLVKHTWPEDVTVRVRVGIHTGEPWTGETGYVGMDIHRAARIANAGYGGQVLISESTYAIVRDELPNGVSLLDLGCHILKDIRRPEHIYQLVIEGLHCEFPPLKTVKVLAAEGTRLGVLEIQQSKDPTRMNERIELSKPVTHLGRKGDNDISFPKDSPVSRHHAVIKVCDGKIILGEVVEMHEDSGQPTHPTYGTFVNDKKVEGPVELKDGDVITLGITLRMRFETARIKPTKKNQSSADPRADLRTSISPAKSDATRSSNEVGLKIGKIGDRMPTSVEVKEVIARLKSKATTTKEENQPRHTKEEGD